MRGGADGGPDTAFIDSIRDDDPVYGHPDSSCEPIGVDPGRSDGKYTDGAVAFVQFYFEQVNMTWQEPTEGRLPLLAEERCATCLTYEAGTKRLVAARQRYEGPAVSVVSASPGDSITNDTVFVDLRLQQTSASVVDALGNKVSAASPSEFNARAAVTWKEERWFIRAIAEV